MTREREPEAFEAEFKVINAEYVAALDAAEEQYGIRVLPQSMEDLMQQRDRKAWRLIVAALDQHREKKDVTAEVFGQLTAYTGRIYGPRALYMLDMHDALADEAYAEAVPYAWSLAEFPMLAMDKRDWLRLWRKAGFVNDKPRPTEPIRVWRGSQARWKKGMSWTDDEERARWFAKARVNARLYTAVVEPERLLAHLGESARGEDEWVVDTRGLEIEEVST